MGTNKREKPTSAQTPDIGKTVPAIAHGVGKAAARLEFAAWLISPNRQGTQKDWARTHDVDQATLSSWKKHPEVLGVIANWRDPFKAAFGEVAGALHRRAVKGHVPAARALAEILGENSPDRLELLQPTNLADFLRTAPPPTALSWEQPKRLEPPKEN